MRHRFVRYASILMTICQPLGQGSRTDILNLVSHSYPVALPSSDKVYTMNNLLNLVELTIFITWLKPLTILHSVNIQCHT